MTGRGGNGSTGNDRLVSIFMVLVGMLSMAWGSYLTLQRDDTDEMRRAIGELSRQVSVLEYRMVAIEQRERERRQDERGGE